ncbi:MAG: hypothetical protein VB130_07730 [Clostridium sp.]|nr:hypothetical protein [Clostridium sp.]
MFKKWIEKIRINTLFSLFAFRDNVGRDKGEDRDKGKIGVRRNLGRRAKIQGFSRDRLNKSSREKNE